MSDNQRLEHLKMLQGVIERMARESATMKNYCLASVAAIFSVSAATQQWALTLVGALIVAAFWWLDASYLAQERWFRDMYDRARRDELELFVMTPPQEIRLAHTQADTIFGWSTSGLYGPLVVLMVLVPALVFLGSR